MRRLWFRVLSFARLYRRLILIERSLTEPLAAAPTGEVVRVALLAPGDLGAYRKLRPDHSGDQVQQRLGEGQECFAVWRGEQIVHVTWAITGRARIGYLSTELDLAADEVYVHDGFTAREFRGLGMSPVRSAAMARHFRDRGFRRLLGAIHPENRVAFRPTEKVGYRRVGIIGYVGVGPWRRRFRRMEPGVAPSGEPAAAGGR